MQCLPLKIACEEKARFLRRRAAAESDYRRAVSVLSAALGSLEKPDADELEDFAASARKIVEGAEEALEQHTCEHRC
jgi:hypothetical protein